jgi:hypothetical protein
MGFFKSGTTAPVADDGASPIPSFWEREDVAAVRAVIDRLKGKLHAAQSEIDKLYAGPAGAVQDAETRRGAEILHAARDGRPLPDFTPAQQAIGNRLAGLKRQRRAIEDALQEPEAELRRLQSKYTAEVRRQYEEEFKELDRAALVTGAMFVSATEEIYNLNDRLQKLGYSISFSPTLPCPLGRTRHGDINGVLAKAVKDGLLSGSEEWLQAFNHDGKFDRPPRKPEPYDGWRDHPLAINWR